MSIYTGLLYNETNALSLVLLIIALVNIIESADIRTKMPSLMGFVISLMILTVGDIFWAFVNSSVIAFTPFWGYFTNLIYFIGTLSSVYFLFMISQDVYGYSGNYRKKALIFAIPFAIDTIFVCLTPITHMVFEYIGNEYHRSFLYTVTLAIPYCFVIYLCISSFVRSFMTKYFIIRRSLRIMALYSAITLLLSFFQLISTNVFPLYVVGGTLICLVICIDNLKEINTVDQVTKLQTHRSFENYLSDLMERGCAPEKSIYLVLADLDDVSSVSDIYGRSEVDAALKDCAGIIRKSVPTSWFTARFSDSCFAIVGICASEEIEHICLQLSGAYEDYLLSSAKPYAISMSIGYASLSYACKTVNDFVRLAERHLEDARIRSKQSPGLIRQIRSGEKHITVPAPSEKPAITQQDINLWMNDALKNGEFIPYFQPQINIEDGTVSGAEALVRWIHPEKGMIVPSVFIPVFERNGFIYEMDKAIWHSVCAHIRAWKDAGITIPPISVNVSRWDVVQNDFTSVLLSYLEEFDLQPSELHLEITESAYLFDQAYLAGLMENLQKLGFEIEMDDFGSGYSSLTAFKDLPFNLIKLDSSLVRESTKTEKAGNILAGIVSLTRNLDLPLIAEGIEYKEQAEFLRDIGCYHMQGFLFARPMPADKFVEFIRDWKISKM